MPRSPIQFDEFSLDCERYELVRAGCPIKLEKIPMELLILLVDKNGNLVTRQEIVEQLWGKDVFVDTEQGINTAIRKIRIVLRDDPEKPRFVQTVTGKGYRFVGQRINGNASEGAVLDHNPPPNISTSPAYWVNWAKPALIAALLLLSTAVMLAFYVAGIRERIFGSNHLAPIRSIAVLPLVNLSGDPSQDYFADGMTDEVITMLAKNTPLRVVSRTSAMQYKTAKKPLRDIGRELGVDGILEGSVERSGNKVHMTVQLIHAASDTHVWAESYDHDASDVISLQSELAQTIVRQVGLTASASSHPAKRINPEAHDAYLMGRYYWFTNNYEKSLEYFEKATSLQPDYAAAWSGIADSYIAPAVGGESPATNAVANGEPAAQKALALDDSAAEAHVTMAAVFYFLRWDWAGAERESRRAIEINPRLAEARHVRSLVLRTLGRTDEALQQEKEAMGLDPFARPGAMAQALINARKFDVAISEARLRSEAQPDNVQLHDMLRSAYMHRRMDKEAAEQWEAVLQLSGDKQAALEVHQAFTRGGLMAVHEWELSGLKKQARKGYVAQLDFAAVYAHMKSKEEALHYLELTYQEREPWLAQIQNMPSFDFLHSEPRYQAIMKKMGLPQEQ